MARATLPKILWGAAFANTLNVAQPLDSAVSYPVPREGSEWNQGPSGVRDAWIIGDDQRLTGDVRWIPTADVASPAATGWDGAAGWRAFLQWARGARVFRFFPDAALAAYVEAYLIDPMQGEPGLEEDGSRSLRITIESADGSAFDGY